MTLFCDSSKVGPPFTGNAWLVLDGFESFVVA